jgi:glycerophosphoryl diester phosphodiesterase
VIVETGNGSGGQGLVSALRAAIEYGADAIALDVMRCGTGELVVFHEHTLTQFGGGRWDDVAQMPLATLRQIDLGGGARIPLLAEALVAVPAPTLIDLRLRPAPATAARERGELVTSAAAVVAQARVTDRVVFAAVDASALDAAPANVAIAQIIQAMPIQVSRPPLRLPNVVELELPHADRRTVRRWQSAGSAVHLWPVNTTSQLVLAWSLRVDGVITCDPRGIRHAMTRLDRLAG